MIIYPAIDLLGGKCVRLRQGDYNQVTVYSEDPLETAWQFKRAGADWLHIVDLDAARTGAPVHAGLIREICSSTGIKVQTGGGIRNMQHLMVLLEEFGIDRAVLGTAAVRDRNFTEEALKLYGGRIAIGIDARDGEVSVSGWTSGSGIRATELALAMAQAGARTIIYTDIARDGMLVGPALESTAELIEKTQLDIIASGGIGSIDDINAVRETGAAGVIVGRAIYEGKVRLDQCWQNE
jgi:phosphoribosylformimino-5-aminoimidazole carboxamide ribotide isomerase